MTDNQENGGDEPIMVSLPDGTKVNINTKEGANAFLEGTPNFLHFSSNLKQIRKLRSRKRLNKRQQNQLDGLYKLVDCIPANADRNIFATKIPQSEIQDWLNYIIEEIKSFSNSEEWISAGMLKRADSIVFYLCLHMFDHAGPVSMAFENEFFRVFASFIKAWNGNGIASFSVSLCYMGHILIGTLSISSVRGWSVEKILNKFEASGLLEQIIRVSVLFKSIGKFGWDEAGLIFVLGEILCCPGILARKFKSGEACGDILNRALDDVQDGSRTIEPGILYRFRFIATLVKNMDSTDFEAKLVSGACSFCAKKTDTKLQTCDRCGFVFYCSKECQKADWKRHRCNCHKLNKAALDRLFSLRMNIIRFMNQHYQIVVEEMSETGLEASDLAVEISLMPDENGAFPAFQDPPAFSVVPIRGYVAGEFPGWFPEGWNTDPQRKWLKDMTEMVETVCKPAHGTLVVYHAGRIHVDIGILEQYHEAAGRLEDIHLQLGTKYWCSHPVALCQKYPAVLDSQSA